MIPGTIPSFWTLAQDASPTPLLPAWFVFPLAGVTLLIIAAHLGVIRRSRETPASRRRIRSVNAVLMMCTVPLLAYAFGVATTADARTFTLVWLLIIGLLVIVMLVAWIDAMNTVRLHQASRAETRAHLRELRAQFAARLAKERAEREGGQSEPEAERGGGS